MRCAVLYCEGRLVLYCIAIYCTVLYCLTIYQYTAQYIPAPLLQCSSAGTLLCSTVLYCHALRCIALQKDTEFIVLRTLLSSVTSHGLGEYIQHALRHYVMSPCYGLSIHVLESTFNTLCVTTSCHHVMDSLSM